MMRRLALALATAALASGCSSSSDDLFGANGATTTAGAGGGASTQTVGSGPRAALNVEIYAQPEQECPAGNVHVDVGNASASPPVLVADGQGGAHVACSIAPGGDAFAVTASIEDGPRVFTLDGLVTGGQSAIGHVRLEDPAAGVPYESTKKHPCLFQFGAGQGVGADHLDVGFDCGALRSTADEGKACSARYGKLRLEGCTAP
jgi:hypothetical protein